MSAMLEIMAFGDDYVDIGMLRLLEKALPWEMRSEGSRKMRTVSSEAIDEDGIAEYLAAVIQTNTKLPLHKAMFRPDQIRAVCSVPFFSFHSSYYLWLLEEYSNSVTIYFVMCSS